jgi:hypothetical protein
MRHVGRLIYLASTASREPPVYLMSPSVEPLKRIVSLKCCRKDASTTRGGGVSYGRGLNILAYFDPLAITL